MKALIKPLVSEKSMSAINTGKYIFIVSSKVSKAEIAREVEYLYQVKVTKVNIIKQKGEIKIARGRFKVYPKIIKKAIITLKKGQKIAGFEEKEG
ncbi:MAG: 50S ribosomal protein L23 [Patescibacteria group bacterium]